MALVGPNLYRTINIPWRQKFLHGKGPDLKVILWSRNDVYNMFVIFASSVGRALLYDVQSTIQTCLERLLAKYDTLVQQS